MKNIWTTVVIVCYIFSVCVCAHAECIELNTFRIYWIYTDKNIEGNVIMMSNGEDDSIPIKNIGNGYMLEGSVNGSVYYASMIDKNHWGIYEIQSNEPVRILTDYGIIRILAYQNEIVYYVKQHDVEPVLVALGKDNSTRYYPYGGHSEEFNFSMVDDGIWWSDSIEQSIEVILYTTTISENGKVAYWTIDGTAWDPESYSESIYISTLDQADLYIGEGSHPVWLDGNRLLYIGYDSKLYQYDVSKRTSSTYISWKNTEIIMPPIGVEERMVAVDGDYIGFIQMGGKQKELSLLSLRTGEFKTIDRVNPWMFMDVIVIINMNR